MLNRMDHTHIDFILWKTGKKIGIYEDFKSSLQNCIIY